MKLVRLSDGYVQNFTEEEANELLKRKGEFEKVQEEEVQDGKEKRTSSK